MLVTIIKTLKTKTHPATTNPIIRDENITADNPHQLVLNPTTVKTTTVIVVVKAQTWEINCASSNNWGAAKYRS